MRKEAILVRTRLSLNLPAFVILSVASPRWQVNILHIRALVKADTVLLFDTYGSADSKLHSVFLYHLEVRVPLPSAPLAWHSRKRSTT